MLLCEALMRVVLQNEALEQGPVEIISVAFLDCQEVMIDLRTELP
jgi:hypothetical protein